MEMEISDEEREEVGHLPADSDKATNDLVNPGVSERAFNKFVEGVNAVRSKEKEAREDVRRGVRGGAKRQKTGDANKSEDVSDDKRERGNKVLTSQVPESSSAFTSDHEAPPDCARDAGVLNSQVPSMNMGDAERLNRQTTVERKIFRVRGSELIESATPVNEVEHIQTRFADDQEGKVSLTLRLPPEQTLTKKGRNHIKIWMILTELKIRPINVVMLNHFSAEADFENGLSANSALKKK
ncbi:uncharacterized protein LOC143895336 [Temnothorax americanus]|uniref:uncharacterized protein LOC143895336 n=1 Tax=Temnothorax americanus TaxID=1964332 RepID=UPI004067D357